MDSQIVIAVALLCLMGLLAGILLSVASKVFKVKENPLVASIRAELPGANCGGCGFPGCDGYAAALAEDNDLPCNKCAVGGPECAAKIAEILGKEAPSSEKMVSFVACNGSCDNAGNLYQYNGIDSCKAAKTLFGGSKNCRFGCIGLGDCVKACQFDAVHIINGVAVVGRECCVACGQCISACPQGLISFKPYKEEVTVKCSNKDAGKNAMSVCKVSCIGCKMCERTCQHDAVHVADNLAVIDPDKCISCGECAAKCPRHAILDLRAGSRAEKTV